MALWKLIVLTLCLAVTLAAKPIRRADWRTEEMADFYWGSTTGAWNAASFGGTLPNANSRIYADGRSSQDFLTLLDRTDDDYIANVVANGTFASDTVWTKGTGWTIAGGLGVAAAGVQSDLSQAGILVLNTVYEVVYTVSGRTAGTITAMCGTGGAGTARSADGTYTENIGCSGSTALIFRKSDTFDGDIDNVVVRATGLYATLIEFKESFLGDVGESGNPLVACAADVIFRGRGNFYFKPGTGSIGLSVLRLTIDTPNLTQEILIGPTFDNSNINDFRVHRGRLQVASLLQHQSLEVGFRNNAFLDSKVTVAVGVPFHDIFQIGGELIYMGDQSNAEDRIVVAGGRCQFDGYGENFYQTGGHVEFDMHPENNPSGTIQIAEARLLRGSMDSVAGGTGVITTAYIGPNFEISDAALAKITTVIPTDEEP